MASLGLIPYHASIPVPRSQLFCGDLHYLQGLGREQALLAHVPRTANNCSCDTLRTETTAVSHLVYSVGQRYRTAQCHTSEILDENAVSKILPRFI